LEQIDLLAKTASEENHIKDERTCVITIFNHKRRVKKNPHWGAENNPDVRYAGETRS